MIKILQKPLGANPSGAAYHYFLNNQLTCVGIDFSGKF
jgi:hypothetical protein